MKAKLQLPVDSAVTLTALLATSFGTVFESVNVLLFLLFVLAIFLDQLSGILKAIVVTPKNEHWFDGTKFLQGGAKKGLLIVGVVMAGSIDIAIIHFPGYPAELGDWSPITKVVLAYMLIGLWGSIIKNISIVKEAKLATSFLLRKMDTMQLGGEPPMRRSYDRRAKEYEETYVDGEK